jgi:hypothetical protein
MNDFSERIIVGIGKVLGTVADLLPGGNDDWCERDYERAVRRAEKVLPEDGGEALEPVSMRFTDVLGPEARDAEWVSKYGARWRWKGDRWETVAKDSKAWFDAPVGYTPQASGPFTAVAREKMDWRGWAVPAILEVLAEETGFADEGREDLADKIADRIACDPRRAIKALRTSDSLNL